MHICLSIYLLINQCWLCWWSLSLLRQPISYHGMKEIPTINSSICTFIFHVMPLASLVDIMIFNQHWHLTLIGDMIGLRAREAFTIHNGKLITAYNFKPTTILFYFHRLINIILDSIKYFSWTRSNVYEFIVISSLVCFIYSIRASVFTIVFGISLRWVTCVWHSNHVDCI